MIMTIISVLFKQFKTFHIIRERCCNYDIFCSSKTKLSQSDILNKTNLVCSLTTPDNQLGVIGHVGDDDGLVAGRLDNFRLLLPGDIGWRLSDDVALELQHLTGGHGDVLQVLTLNLWWH